MKTERKAALRGTKERRHRTDEEVRTNHAQIEERNAHFRRFGYDSEAAVAFVIAKALPLSGRVLDIGTGKGRCLIALARHAADVTTVDLSARDQHCAQLEAAHAGVAGRIRFVVRDAGRLPWRSARFDAVVSMNACHHMDDPDRVFAEMLRVLKPGGKLVIADFSLGGFHLMDKIHRAEGRRHPHPPSKFVAWTVRLQSQGFRVKRFRGCHQEVIVAVHHQPAA